MWAHCTNIGFLSSINQTEEIQYCTHVCLLLEWILKQIRNGIVWCSFLYGDIRGSEACGLWIFPLDVLLQASKAETLVYLLTMFLCLSFKCVIFLFTLIMFKTSCQFQTVSLRNNFIKRGPDILAWFSVRFLPLGLSLTVIVVHLFSSTSGA